MFEKIKAKCRKECDECILSWEESSYEGECCGCGCMLYREFDAGRLACCLPNSLLQPVRKYIENRNDKSQARACDGISEWIAKEEKRDKLFRNAIDTRLLTDHTGQPVQLFYHTPEQAYIRLRLGAADYDSLRFEFEMNQTKGMAPQEALKAAVENILPPDLYHETGQDRYEPLDITANYRKACQAYQTDVVGAGAA